MIVPSVIISILLALLFATLLVFVFKRKGPGPIGGFLFLVLIIFMFTWASGSWMQPVGPIIWGIHWLGYLAVALMIMLLLGTLLPPFRRENQRITEQDLDIIAGDRKANANLGIAFGIFFWLMMISLFVLVIIKLVG
jgi:hypothetical protein